MEDTRIGTASHAVAVPSSGLDVAPRGDYTRFAMGARQGELFVRQRTTGT